MQVKEPRATERGSLHFTESESPCGGSRGTGKVPIQFIEAPQGMGIYIQSDCTAHRAVGGTCRPKLVSVSGDDFPMKSHSPHPPASLTHAQLLWQFHLALPHHLTSQPAPLALPGFHSLGGGHRHCPAAQADVCLLPLPCPLHPAGIRSCRLHLLSFFPICSSFWISLLHYLPHA